MILRFDSELSRQEVYAHGGELASVMGHDRDATGARVHSWPSERELHVATFSEPILVTDGFRVAQEPPTLRDTIFKLYESPVRITQYAGTSIRFDERLYPGVWGPSIDTLLLCKALSRMDLSSVRRVAELGAGSGFVSAVLLALAPRLESITLVDLSPEAIACCRAVVRDSRARFVCGDALEELRQSRFDLVVSNPPYIPRPASCEDNPYEGSGLAVETLARAHEHLNPRGRIVLVTSSLSRARVAAAAGSAGLESRELLALEVPLKVCNVLNNASWLGYLRGRGLESRLRRGYEYWQTISILEAALPAG